MWQASAGAAEFILGALGTRLSDLLAEIAAAGEVGDLIAAAPHIRATGFGLLDLDAGADLATRVVAQLNDALTERAITLVAARHRLPSAPWCWLSMGSEGRCEQTFVTDQDNGLMFGAETGEAPSLRRHFLPFAQAVNDALAACGFPRCPGNIMAGNPDCCLSLDEWRERFSGWVRLPDPEALLNATIYFDFRPLYGDVGLATALRGHLLGLTAGNSAFLRMMALNALAAEPPLGLFGEISAEDRTGCVDLKKSGARIFVDAARILALDAGMSPLNTAERLRAVAAAGAMTANDATAAIKAFAHVQCCRLENQRDLLRAGAAADNRIVLARLCDFEKRMLRAAFSQAKQLQQMLKVAYAAEL